VAQLKNSPSVDFHLAIHVLKSSSLGNGHGAQGSEKTCIRRSMCVMKERNSHLVEKEGREKEGAMLEAYMVPCVCHAGIPLGFSKVLLS